MPDKTQQKRQGIHITSHKDFKEKRKGMEGINPSSAKSETRRGGLVNNKINTSIETTVNYNQAPH